MSDRGRVFRRGRRSTAMHLLARMGLLHDFTLEEGVEYPVEDAYLNAPVRIVPGVIHEINVHAKITP